MQWGCLQNSDFCMDEIKHTVRVTCVFLLVFVLSRVHHLYVAPRMLIMWESGPWDGRKGLSPLLYGMLLSLKYVPHIKKNQSGRN